MLTRQFSRARLDASTANGKETKKDKSGVVCARVHEREREKEKGMEREMIINSHR